MASLGINFRHDPAHQRKAALAKHAQSSQTALNQAVALQLSLYNAGLAMGEDVKDTKDKVERARAAQVLAGVAKGWQSMNDQIRIMKGRPLPGSLRPVQASTKTKPKQAQVSPVLDSTSTVQPMPVQPSTDTP